MPHASTSSAGSIEIEKGTVESSDGTALGYRRLGSGPAVVVCHGAFAAADDWMPFAAELADTHTVYLYDRRGRGSSPLRTPDFEIDAEIDDLAAVVALAGSGAALVGHSFGGGCVLGYAAREGFEGPVVVYEPRHSIDTPVSGGHIPFVRSVLASGDRDAAVRAIHSEVLGLPDAAIDSIAQTPLWERMLATVDAFPDELRFLDSLVWKDDDLHGIAGPCWLLVGEDSPVQPADREGVLESVLPGLRTVTIGGQGHFAYRSDPALLARIVRECLGASAAELGR